MSKPNIRQQHWSQSTRVPVAITGLTLAVFAAAILLLTQHLRQRIRREMVGNDADILHAVALMLQMEQSEAVAGSNIEEPAMLFDVVLKTSRLRGVIAARLFDGRGKFIASFPASANEGELEPDVLDRLRGSKTFCRFYDDFNSANLFLAPSPGHGIHAPMMEAFIPLRGRRPGDFAGAAQFFMDGRPVAGQIRNLDFQLGLFAAVVFVVGGILIATALLWSFHRLQRAHRLLAERSTSLLEASQQLAMTTRTSAVGAISTHLLHEMKSLSFGLRSLLSSAPASPNQEAALDAARRMQAMINQTLEIIHAEQGVIQHYEVSLGEFADVITHAVRPLSEKAGVIFIIENHAHGVLSNRTANLVLIILTHLLQNALQATPARKTVTLSFQPEDDALCFQVRDEGRGFPPALLDSLFKSCVSTKEGGSGIGLMLCKQLADHLGAELKLAENTPEGCRFVLKLPRKSTDAEQALAQQKI